MKRFITDMGSQVTVTETLKGADNETIRETTRNIGRFGVWEVRNRKAEVIDTGDDLDALQAEYGPDLPVRSL